MQLRLSDRVGVAELQRLRRLGQLAAGLGLSAWLVGGAVRDALLGRASLDLDITVEGDALSFAQRLAADLPATLTCHERFGTAVLQAGEFHLDVVTARRELYPHPGALPVVSASTLDDDLRRRDFTINAMALRLDASLDHLYDPLGGQDDLRAGLVRGLHERTFLDDPTRLLRLARYAARLGYRVEPHTREWLDEALRHGTLGLVSGQRLWLELQRLLCEPAAAAACGLLRDWDALAPLHLAHGAPELLAGLGPAAQALAPAATSVDHSLAALALLAGPQAPAVCAHLGLTAAERDATVAAADLVAAPPACIFARGAKNSTLYAELATRPPAAWLALYAAQPACRDSLARLLPLLGMRADLTGEDLQAAGYAPSPGFRLALQEALRVKLDRAATREEQLAAALQALQADQRDVRR